MNAREELVAKLRDLKRRISHEENCASRPEIERRCDCDREDLYNAIDETIAALSAQQEPVAWMWIDADGEKQLSPKSLAHMGMPNAIPLYTAPPSEVREGIALQELQNIVNAKRFDVDKFDDDTAFADWAQSRARRAITRAAEQVNAEIQPSAPSDVIGPVKHDAPVMKAWNNYKAGDDFRNTRRWALHEAHVDGSLWAAFYAGYFACAVDSTDPSAPQSEQTHVRVPVEQLEHWVEYWNGSANEKAMSDALEHILGEVSDLLRAATGKESEHGK